MRCIHCLMSVPYNGGGSTTDLRCSSCSEIMFFEPEELLDPSRFPETALTPEFREGQLKIANEIYDRLFYCYAELSSEDEKTNGAIEPYMIEGGVGVGKTLGYIVGFLPILYLPKQKRSYISLRHMVASGEPNAVRRFGPPETHEPLPWIDRALDFRHKSDRLPVKAVISTESKGLQAQVAEVFNGTARWIESLYRRHGHRVDIEGYQLQGKGNYVCPKVLDKPETAGGMLQMMRAAGVHGATAAGVEEFLGKMEEIMDKVHGSNLAAGTTARAYKMLEDDGFLSKTSLQADGVARSVQYLVNRGCNSPSCGLHTSCSLQRATSAVKSAQTGNENASMVLLNHAGLCTHYKLGIGSATGQYLSHANVVIVDEAHKLGEVAQGVWREEISESALQKLLSDMAALGNSPTLESHLAARIRVDVASLRAQVTETFDDIRDLYRGVVENGADVPGAMGGVLGTGLVTVRPFQAEMIISGYVEGGKPDQSWTPPQLDKVRGAMSNLAATLGGSYKNLRGSNMGRDVDKEQAAGSRKATEGLALYAQVYQAAVEAMKEANNTVRVAFRGKLLSVEMSTTPSNVPSLLQAAIGNPLFVMTSGTLLGPDRDPGASLVGVLPTYNAIRGSKIQTLTPRLLYVPSPFDYASKAVMYVPKDPALTPPHNAAKVAVKAVWYAALASHILEVARVSNGFTFVLCTSVLDMNTLRTGMKAQMDLEGFPSSTQKDFDSVDAAVQWYKEVAADSLLKSNRGPIMFGVASLWTGVSIAGDALKSVVVTKIPFPPPTGPDYTTAVKVHGEYNVFSAYTLPGAVKQLRQGEGRLIRTSTDTGVFALLDYRIWAKPYGSSVMLSLQTRKNQAHSMVELRAAWANLPK